MGLDELPEYSTKITKEEFRYILVLLTMLVYSDMPTESTMIMTII